MTHTRLHSEEPNRFPRTKFAKYRPLTRLEALVFWVEFLQEDRNASRQRSDNNPPSDLKLMVQGYARDYVLFTEVDLWEDEPINILDQSWLSFQIWD